MGEKYTKKQKARLFNIREEIEFGRKERRQSLKEYRYWKREYQKITGKY